MSEQLLNDRLLVKKMLAGEEEAFENFFALYFPGLFRFALIRLIQDAAAAEEVVQAALCKAISKLASYRGESTLFTWLCTFCRHEISAYLKQEARFRVQPKLIEDDPEALAVLESLGMATEDRPDRMALR